MSNSAYLLVRFNDKQKLPQAIQKLQDEKMFDNYDAVDGHYHLMIKETNHNDETISIVKGFDGFSEMSVCNIEKDNQKDFVLDETNTYTYLFIEAEDSMRNALIEKIQSFEETLFVSPTSGTYNIIGLVKHETFDKIDRFIKTEINNLDGILRFKQDHVIFLDRI